MDPYHSWQPTIAISNLKQRARLIQKLRTFFANRDILEVETPTLANHPVTDPHLTNFETRWFCPSQLKTQTLYLQTSPEYAMKRLLCAGSGSIYQICKAFRNEEHGRFHNAEFTILEWYRVNFDHWQLIDEVEALLIEVLQCPKATRTSYQQAFLSVLNIDPLSANLAELQACCTNLGYGNIANNESNPDTLLQLLFCEKIETTFDPDTPQIIYHFPASQAALAKLNKEDKRIAERFEVYFKGVELANGFHELSDPAEQQIRFEQDNALRSAMNLPSASTDKHLLQALEHGLPPCAGVALGVDRLLMIALGANHIEDVVSFTTPRA